MLNPKGKLAHAVRAVWFVSIFILPLLVLTEDDVVAQCGGYPSGGPGIYGGGCGYEYNSDACRYG